jgi:alginate O-acetyltransferase complex protein AlgI
MLFPTGIFAIFFAVVFLGHWSLVRFRPEWHRGFLLVANLAFYAFWSVELCGALLLAGRGGPRRWLWLGIAGALAWLFWFKYTNFFLQEVVARLDWLGIGPIPLLDIVLPVGVSFYVFQAISYMVDAHEGAAEPEPSPLNVLVYLTFFPHLAAGPIVRAAHFLPQLHTPMVIASELATGIVDPVFRDPSAHGALDIWLATYGYTIQIFCDFSAYSDMAIGFAALLGYHFPKNFDQPFRALSLSEFWRRWHISLSFWLRDYVYIRCFGGNRRNAGFALMATMVLGGIWHGAAWTFVLWGLVHGVALWIERLLGGKERPAGRVARVVRWAITFHIVVFAFVLFRAHDLAGFGAMMTGLFAFDLPSESATWRLLALVLLGLSFHFWPADLRERIEARARHLPPLMLGVLAGAALLLILQAGPEGVAPFIYFQF